MNIELALLKGKFKHLKGKKIKLKKQYANLPPGSEGTIQKIEKNQVMAEFNGRWYYIPLEYID